VYPRRVRVLAGLFVAALAAVAVQLVRLQLVHGGFYAELAREGRVWDELESAPRGRILDARGRLLACDEPAYGLGIVAREFPLGLVRPSDVRELASLPAEERSRARAALSERLEAEAAVAALATLSGCDRGELARGVLAALEKASRYGSERAAEPAIFGIDHEAWLRLEVLLSPPGRRGTGAAGSAIPGVRCIFRARRSYPFGSAACHVLGHLGEYEPAELELLRRFGLLPDADLARASGLREALRGAWPALARELGWPGADDELSTERVVSLLSMDEETRRRLASSSGPAWPQIESFLERGALARLAEGELVWVNSRGHLEDRRIGRMGVERSWNERLRGRHGYRVVIRNVTVEDGRPVPELDYLRAEHPSAGGDVELGLDLAFQRAVETILASAGRRGAAVFLNPATGSILALASIPGFDPNAFGPSPRGDVAGLLADPEKPLLNRATQGLYPPGSVFKVLVAAAALEEGAIAPDERIECSGGYEVDGRIFRCLAEGGHGPLDAAGALAQSCNVFFYQAAERLGARAIARWSRKFGLAARTGVDLPGEAAGSVPTEEDADHLSRRTLVQLGIGQGPISVTPLQVAGLFACLATGVLHEPRAARPAGSDAPLGSIERSPQGPEARGRGRSETRRVLRVNRLSDATRRVLLAGLVGTVHDPKGTAHAAFASPPAPGERSFAGEFPEIKVAGKTGTAERPGGPPHSWFAGFAPAEDPEVAFAVVIEGGGSGGRVAAPAAARMLAAYFRLARRAAAE